MVTVKITETYDLRTDVGKMGILGVHTPSTTLIKKIWGNAIKSHRYMRLLGCNVQMACASLLPADPLQVGTEEGSIAPQDLFNPILYTAVSNEGFDRILNRIYENTNVDTGNIGSVNSEDYESSATGIYYALLAEGRFKKAMPQAGLEMSGLKPIVFPMLATYGNAFTSDASNGNIGLDYSGLGKIPGKEGKQLSTGSALMRGRPMDMPAIPTTAVYSTSSATSGTVMDASFPKSFVACIITPPAVLHVLYYRLKITWFIELSGLKSDIETATLTGIAAVGNYYYTSAIANAKMEQKAESIDATDMSIEPVMVASK